MSAESAHPNAHGARVTVTIAARRRRNATGVVLEAGRRYRLTAEGDWSDGGIACGPRGYLSSQLPCPQGCALALTERLRVVPGAPWFALVGMIDSDRATAFEIGAGTVLRATRGGELVCCANDVPAMYWNNRGTIELTVEPLEAGDGTAGPTER